MAATPEASTIRTPDRRLRLYWQRYGWVAPEEDVSGLEDEYRLATGLPQLIYIKEPAPAREPLYCLGSATTTASRTAGSPPPTSWPSC